MSINVQTDTLLDGGDDQLQRDIFARVRKQDQATRSKWRGAPCPVCIWGWGNPAAALPNSHSFQKFTTHKGDELFCAWTCLTLRSIYVCHDYVNMYSIMTTVNLGMTLQISNSVFL